MRKKQHWFLHKIVPYMILEHGTISLRTMDRFINYTLPGRKHIKTKTHGQWYAFRHASTIPCWCHLSWCLKTNIFDIFNIFEGSKINEGETPLPHCVPRTSSFQVCILRTAYLALRYAYRLTTKQKRKWTQYVTFIRLLFKNWNNLLWVLRSTYEITDFALCIPALCVLRAG